MSLLSPRCVKNVFHPNDTFFFSYSFSVEEGADENGEDEDEEEKQEDLPILKTVRKVVNPNFSG